MFKSHNTNTMLSATFKVLLLCEAQRDLASVAPGAVAVLGDTEAEAGHTATADDKVSFRTVTWKETQRNGHS